MSTELPGNRSAERAATGAGLILGHIPEKFLDLPGKDFSGRRFGEIWDAEVLLSSEGKAITLSALSALLGGNDPAREGPILSELTLLTAEPQSSMFLEDYVDLIRVASAKRKLALALSRMAKIAFGPNGASPDAVFTAAAAELERAQEGIEPTERERWTAAELAALEIPSDPWLVERLVIASGLNLIAGEFASGKTYLVMDLAIAVATGGLAWGRNVRPGRVLFLGADNSRSNLVRRLRQLLDGRGIEAPMSLYFDLSPLDVGNAAGLGTLKSVIEKVQADLVIIDALSRYMGSIDENSAADVGRMMAGFREIANETGCTFVLVHHLRKVGTQFTNAKIADRIRGSGDFVGAVDSAVVLTTRGKGDNLVRTLEHVKSREGEESEPLNFIIGPGENGGVVLEHKIVPLEAPLSLGFPAFDPQIVEVTQEQQHFKQVSAKAIHTVHVET